VVDVPLPEVNVAVTVVVFRRDRLVPESSTSTTGWITKGAPARCGRRLGDNDQFRGDGDRNVVVAEVSRLSEKVML